jgi:hypothetical protein
MASGREPPWCANTSGAESTRCVTTQRPILNQLETRCEYGERAISRYNRVLDRWQTTIETPAKLQPKRGDHDRPKSRR